MPRLIVKIPCTKGRTKKDITHRKRYVKYMAAREGAEKLSPPILQRNGNYTEYIASRPRAERAGGHALFSGTDEPIVLSQVAEEIANHPGNVWQPIISLKNTMPARRWNRTVRLLSIGSPSRLTKETSTPNFFCFIWMTFRTD